MFNVVSFAGSVPSTPVAAPRPNVHFKSVNFFVATRTSASSPTTTAPTGFNSAVRLEDTIAWYDADPARRKVDEAFNRTSDRILAAYQTAWPK